MGREVEQSRHMSREPEDLKRLLQESLRSGTTKCIIHGEEVVTDIVVSYGWTKDGFAKRVRFKGEEYNIVRKDDVWTELKGSGKLETLPVEERRRTTKDGEVELFKLNWVGDNVPMFCYDSERFGQITWLARRCKEEGIKTQTESDYILLYAKSKADRFKELVKESFKFDDMKPAPIKGKTATFHIGLALACVIVEEETFVTEPHLGDLIEFIFKKQIPHTKVFRIFPTKKEMERSLLEEHRVMI